MFAKTIIDSDAFLDMPLSTQCLYFHLSMRADDDGFINNPKKVQKMIGASDDDLKLLIMKNFIIPFESGIVVIKHWKIHNYIRNDRYKPTAYQDEKQQLEYKKDGAYTFKKDIPLIENNVGIPNAYQMETQVRLGKDRLELGKDIDKLVRHKYGEYQNVLLSDEQLEKLQNEFPADWKTRIERVSEYCASTGKSYTNYLATIRNWAKKEHVKTQPTTKPNSFHNFDGKIGKMAEADLEEIAKRKREKFGLKE